MAATYAGLGGTSRRLSYELRLVATSARLEVAWQKVWGMLRTDAAFWGFVTF